MAGIIYTHIDFRKPPWVGQHRLRKIMRAAHVKMGIGWWQHMLPLHFKQPASGGGIYAYQARSSKYLKRKQRGKRRRGQARDAGQYALVHSGLTRQKATQARPAIRGFPSRVRVTLPTPSYISMRPRKPAHPWMGQEIVAVTPSEVRSLRKILKKQAEVGFEAARHRSRRTVRP